MPVLERPHEAKRLAPPTPEANALRAEILDACLHLFNNDGFASVTTARIAETLHMNEGRLHYYFNTKRQIVLALFERFETAAIAAAAHGLDATDRYADYQENWFLLMWHYRFFYRDQRTLHRTAPELQKRLAHLYTQGQTRFRHVLDDMVALNLITATPTQLDQLVINAWVISSYWIDYVTTSRATQTVTQTDLKTGMRQIDSLFAPYLTPRHTKAAS